jgi:hypothetical protein
LLARLAERSLRSGAAELDLERLVRRAGRLASSLGLDPCCLDATLLTACVRGDLWRVTVAGDGVVAWQDRDGCVQVRSISFAGGYPEYPSYLASPERRRGFDAVPGNEPILRRIILEPDGRTAHLAEERLPPGGFHESGTIRDTAWVALLSDGAASFVARNDAGSSTPIELGTVLAELLAFKSLQGVFVQRRLTRFSQQCGTRGWGHQDDLAVGAISFGA